MWVFLNEGFFSAVFDKYCKPNEMMIRARCKGDLVRLSKKLHGYSEDSDILEFENADYRYRMKVDRNMWADYLLNAALSIDYSNVKDTIIPAGDKLRHDAYYDVWTALYRWQSIQERAKKMK